MDGLRRLHLGGSGYADSVRGYHGLGGTVGLAGTFEDPAGCGGRASSPARGSSLAGVGASALVRPWGVRVPRRLLSFPR